MNRPNMTRRWAVDGECHTVPDEKYLEGFIKEKPDEYFTNQLQLEEEAFYIANMEAGLPTNGEDAVEYSPYSLYMQDGELMVRTPDGVFPSIASIGYRSLVGQLLQLTGKLTLHAVRTDDPHSVTPAQAGTYTKPEFDDMLNGQSGALSDHLKQVNPHKVTHTQINCLSAAGGGVFTGEVEFAEGFSIRMFALRLLDKQLTFGSEAMGRIGLDEQTPFFQNSRGKFTLFHEGNYLTERNKFENLYKSPPPTCIIPFLSSLNFRHGSMTIYTDWDDLEFTPAGLTLAGEIVFTDEEYHISTLQTLRVGVAGGVVLTWGNVVITSTAESLKVEDSGTVIWEGVGGKYLTYTRDGHYGSVYIDGLREARTEYTAAAPATACSISGTGSIKELSSWNVCMNDLQVSELG